MKNVHQKILGITLATAITGFALVTPAMAAVPTHKVRPGESLWSIARQYEMDIDQLARLNGIKKNSIIKMGMVLTLGPHFQTYTVRTGESLWSISRKFGVNYQELVKFNNLKKPDDIRSGMTLKIPSSGQKTGGTLNIPEFYTVKSGESLWSIANKFNINYNDLIKYNNLQKPDRISAGMKLRLSPELKQHKVKSGESLWIISQKYGIAYQQLIEYNNIKKPDQIKPGMILKIPSSNNPASVGNTYTSPKSGQNSQHVTFSWPAKGQISSPFGIRWGKLHKGIDIALPIGRNVKAAASGKVILSGWVSGYGYTVIIEHGKGYKTLYGHNSKLLVKGGTYVSQGQVIAKSGNSGRSTGPHLHFEIQKDGKALNPIKYLN